MHFTDTIFNLINGLANKSELLDLLMISISKYGPYVLMGIGVATYLAGIIKRDKELRCTVVDTVLKTGIAIVFSQIIGSIIYMPRPFVNNENVNLLYSHSENSSFPSDHSIGSMGIALGLGKYSSSLNKFYITLAFLIGISRVYVGHHYPLDVMGGFIIAMIFCNIYDKYLKQHIRKIYCFCEDMLFSKKSLIKKED